MKKKNTTHPFLTQEHGHSEILPPQFDIFHLSASILSAPENLSFAKVPEQKWKINITLLQ